MNLQSRQTRPIFGAIKQSYLRVKIMDTILSKFSASISELKKNPSALLNKSEGSPIAILNHNTPAAYLIPAKTYERLLNKIEDIELAQIVKDRLSEKEHAIEIDINEL
jgi:antitoxin StbD